MPRVRAHHVGNAANTGAMAALLADEYLNVDRGGIRGKAEIIESVKNYNLTDYNMEEIKVVQLDTNTVCISYRITMYGVPDENRYHSSVWVKRDGKWLNIFFQETLI